MSASIVRNFHRFGKKILQAEAQTAIFRHKRCINDYECVGESVPYFPEEEKKVSLDAEYPDFEILHDEFKYVERLMPTKTVAPPVEHAVYPTPSGWLPPNESLQPGVYAVRRTRNHMLPCYYRKHFNGRETIKVKFIYGDIWKFKEDALEYFKEQGAYRCEIQVHEIGRSVRFRGNCLETVAKFLLSRGF